MCGTDAISCMRCSNLSGLNLEGEISAAIGSLQRLVSM
jgi:hypothetical protein